MRNSALTLTLSDVVSEFSVKKSYTITISNKPFKIKPLPFFV